MKFVRGILALYVLVWFNAVVPAHTRGVVTMPGDNSEQKVAAGGGCCHADDSDSSSDKPTRKQQRNCAVCFVAATYTAATVLYVDLRPTGLFELIESQIQAQLCGLDYPPIFFPTGPPLA